MIFIAISFDGNERKMRAGDEVSNKIFGNTPFQSKENAFVDIKRPLQKGHFRYFTEKGRGLDPLDLPSCEAAFSLCIYPWCQKRGQLLYGSFHHKLRQYACPVELPFHIKVFKWEYHYFFASFLCDIKTQSKTTCSRNCVFSFLYHIHSGWCFNKLRFIVCHVWIFLQFHLKICIWHISFITLSSKIGYHLLLCTVYISSGAGGYWRACWKIMYVVVPQTYCHWS